MAAQTQQRDSRVRSGHEGHGGRAALRAVARDADDVAARRAARAAADAGAVVTVEVPGRALRVSGRLDARSVPDVRDALHAALDAGSGPLELCLDGAVVADATGLGVVVGVHRRALRGGRELVLRDVPLPVLRLLRVTRLQRVLHVAGRDAAADPAARRQNSRALVSSMPRKAS